MIHVGKGPWFLPIALIASFALGQSTSGPFLVNKGVSRVSVVASLRADPPLSPLGRIFTASSRGRSITNGPTFHSRILLDTAKNTYLGYELLLEQQQPGEYLATFGKLGVSPLDLAAGTLPLSSPHGQSLVKLVWTMLSLPEIPEPRVVHDGDIISIVLFKDVETGARLIEDIRISATRPPSAFIPQIPSVSGNARDFMVGDAALQILQPRITLNRSLQATSGPGFRNVLGPLVWLYLPEHGRFILSLASRAPLGFKNAGEVRGGVITFTLGKDSIKLECMSPIATGDAAYNLYVLHEEDWEPTADSQKHLPALGTVSAAELAALQQK
ncbi:MAG TPA: hypothetical protein VEX68_09520 [Bryobacteraceae bacterium]|nr:hypothetical protein [Bryobacteraceae bacterium]